MDTRSLYQALVRDGKTPEQVKKEMEDAQLKQEAPEVNFTHDWVNSNDTRKLGTLLLDKHREALVRAQNALMEHNPLLDIQETLVLEKVINLITKGTYAR